ncbi:MAG: RHS repeat-associated core domain-containing protein [Nitrospirota bacterium]
MGNVTVLANGIQVSTNTALPAGPVEQKFVYDDLYQIVGATGGYTFGPGKGNNYSSDFLYDTIGNFTRKKQVHEIVQPSTIKTFPKETNYTLNYVYNPSDKPHAVRDAGDKIYAYDANGNMTGWTHKQNGTRRNITWNEENRVRQIDDNGKTTYFLYDDSGERVVKRGQHGETIYPNRFFSIRNGELGTKSIYAGETRVVSKLVKTPGTVTANTGTVVTGTTGTTPGIQGLDNGEGKKLGIIKRLTDGATTGRVNPPVEKDEFYYHGDHLGSSNMITDAYGAVYQHLEYFPYGETWIEEGGSYGGNTPGYKFTGKELDPETGLYYYGARYYDPVLSRWISADAMLGKYIPAGNPDQDENLPGLGGIYNSFNLSLYSI